MHFDCTSKRFAVVRSTLGYSLAEVRHRRGDADASMLNIFSLIWEQTSCVVLRFALLHNSAGPGSVHLQTGTAVI